MRYPSFSKPRVFKGAYMGDLPNGFTAFGGIAPGSESAADAIRRARAEEAAAAAKAKSDKSGAQRSSSDAGARSAYGAGAQRDSYASRDAYVQRESGAYRGSGAAQTVSSQASQRKSNSAYLWSTVADASPARDVGAFDKDELDRLSGIERRWAWVEIDKSAIRHNVADVRRHMASRTRLMAVVKADGYGHGAVEVSKAMLGAGADRLAVSNVDEAIDLRKAGISVPILILAQPPAATIPLLLAYNIVPSIYTPEFAIAYAEAADLHGMKAPYHLAINTGMNRIGVRHDDVIEFLYQVNFHRALELEGTYTHFATADGSETLDFQIQTKHFLEAIANMQAAGFPPGLVHAANSAATYRYPDVHFDMVRCGLALYGFHPCRETRDIADLRPAMSVYARITDTRTVPMSEGVSYGLHYRSPGSVKICTVPIGFANGLRRSLSGNLDFIMGGRYYHQVGNICMDQCMFEVDLRSSATRERIDPQIGDLVTIVGSQGIAEVTIDEMAAKLGTIQYEVAIGLSQGMERVYV